MTFDHVGFNAGEGIRLNDSAVSDCVVRNSGNSFGLGMFAGFAASVMRCQFINNPGFGLLLENSTATNVTAQGNGVGIDAGQLSTIADSTAIQNSGDGIDVGSLNTISGNTASSNGGDGIHVSGTGNTISNNTASDNTANGITVLGPGNQVRDNTVFDSHATMGISVTDNGNTVSGNTVHGTSPIVAGSHGIDVSGKHNRIEGNTTTSFDYDYFIGGGAGGKNLVIQNSAADAISGDTWNDANNDVGPRQTAATATDPFANIEY
jgi:parallel beta-helix repeat protein